MEFKMTHDGLTPPSSFTHFMTSRSMTRLDQRMRQAEADARGWVAELRDGSFDAGSGDMFDGRLDALELGWHEQDDREHNACLSELGKRIAKAQRDVVLAEKTVKQAKKDQERAARDYESARARLRGEPQSLIDRSTGETEGNASPSSSHSSLLPIPSPDLTRLPSPTHAAYARPCGPHDRESPPLPGGSPLEPLMWLFVLGAVAGDVAVFYNVLARLFRANPVLVGACTVGFVAATIGICHLIGVGLWQRISADRRRSDTLFWAKVAAWLVLGFFAFFVRLRVGVESPSILQNMGSSNFGPKLATNVDRDLLAALFFAGLYLASGLVAITASFRTFNPAAQQYRRASRNLKKTERNTRSAQAQLAERTELKNVVDAELTRAVEQRERVRSRTGADVLSLKYLVRWLMADRLNDPEAYDIMTRGLSRVNKYPEPGLAS